MKPGLKRIEATLDQLTTAEELTPTPTDHRPSRQAVEAPSAAESQPKSQAKTIQPFPVPKPIETPPAAFHSAETPIAQPSAESSARPTSRPAGKATKSKKAAPQNPQPGRSQPLAKSNSESLPLPKSKPPSFSSHRHAVNPNLAIGLLKEVEAVVMQWQLDLEQTVLQIQALYLEGPIVDGWLESHPVGSPQVMQPIGAATLRHAEIDRLMDYVEEICRLPQTLDPSEAPRTGYRLCGLDADGTLWSRPCPAEQVPYVGLAIARYQKLRILLARKQGLENRLNQLIQHLTFLHGQMQE